MLHLAVVVVSTRPGRQGRAVAEWFAAVARAHGQFEIELVDLAEVGPPLLDEPQHPRLRQYVHEHTKRWSAIVDRADAFVFVTPEYDFGAPASLVNALQCLLQEWAYKPAGFVSYGGVSGGTRGVEAAKQLLTALKVMPMFESVAIPFSASYLDAATGRFDPGEMQAKAGRVMLDELLRWAGALRPLRTPVSAPAAEERVR